MSDTTAGPVDVAFERPMATLGAGVGADPVSPEVEKFRRKKLGPAFWVAVAWLGSVAVAALFATILPVQDPNAIDIPNKLAGPFTEGHLMGTDGLGRDLLARAVHGARISMIVSLSAVGIGVFIGGGLGVIGGYFRGMFDGILVAATSILLAFPGLVLLLGMVAFVGQNLQAICFVIGFLSIPIYFRVARANTMSVSGREFVIASKALGARHLRVLRREVVPVVALPLIAFALIAVGVVIVLEGSLAFLGLSVEPPASTWGAMIAEGRRHLPITAWTALFPSLVMFFTVLSFNYVGDVLRSRFAVIESKI